MRRPRHGGEGSAPRLRREAPRYFAYCKPCGISSAPAERRFLRRVRGQEQRDQLRACGEKVPVPVLMIGYQGSAPRLRRKAPVLFTRVRTAGISSAPAERSLPVMAPVTESQDQLRACGEKREDRASRSSGSGSAPRLRREEADDRRAQGRAGISSAPAERRPLPARS